MKNYEEFVSKYLEACREYPDYEIYISRLKIAGGSKMKRIEFKNTSSGRVVFCDFEGREKFEDDCVFCEYHYEGENDERY